MKDGTREKREFSRIPTKVELEIRRSGTGEKLSGYTQNVSMKGFAIKGLQSIPVGEIVNVVLFVGDRDSGVKIEVKARIAHILGCHIGAEIISHLRMESYNHLERLVLYRSGDEADQIEEEIARHREKA